MNPNNLPGPGDEVTWPPYSGHPNDPRYTPDALEPAEEALAQEERRLRPELAQSLTHALIHNHSISRGTPYHTVGAAEDLECGLGDCRASRIEMQRLISAIANSAPDSEILAHLRAWYAASFAALLDNLVELAAEEGAHITFPEYPHVTFVERGQ